MEGDKDEIEGIPCILNPYSIEMKKGLVVSYNILVSSLHINYLFDYSKILIRSKLFDPQIMNWQIENSLLLKQMGLNFSFIKKKMEERNKGYYKYDTLLSQISCKHRFNISPSPHIDRLEKHGQLAPLKEISKKFTEEDLRPDPEHQKNANDLNYYNQNDSFIDDEEAYKGEDDDGFFKLNLAYGNYTEEEIIRNLNKSKSRKKKNFSKIKKPNAEGKDEKKSDEPANQLLSTGHPLTTESEKPKLKKRKFGDSINMISLNAIDKEAESTNQPEVSEEEHLKIKFNALMKEYCELGFGIPLIEKEKELFIKKIISAIKVLEQKWISEPSSYENFLNIFSSQLNLNQKDFKIIFEYERFRSKIDGIYSNYAKLVNQFVTFLVDASIKDVTNLNEVMKANSEVKQKADSISIKVYSYVKVYNDYWASVSLNASSEEEYYKILDLFIPNGKERNEEYLVKLSSKMKELFEKNKVEYSMKAFIDFFKVFFEQDMELVQLEGRKVFSIEAFFTSEAKPKSTKEDTGQLQANQQQEGPQAQGKKKKLVKSSAFSQMTTEQELKQDEKTSRDIKVPVIQVVIAQSPPQPLAVAANTALEVKKETSKEKKLIPNSKTNYQKQLIPIISTEYYTCPYNEDHFINLHSTIIKNK